MVIIMVVLAGIEVIVAIASAVLAAMAQVYEVSTACEVIYVGSGGGGGDIMHVSNLTCASRLWQGRLCVRAHHATTNFVFYFD